MQFGKSVTYWWLMTGGVEVIVAAIREWICFNYVAPVWQAPFSGVWISSICMNPLLEKYKNKYPVCFGESAFGKNISNLTVSNEGIASQQFFEQLFANSLWARIDPS